MSDETGIGNRRAWLGWLLFGATAAAIFALGMLFASIVERRGEAKPQPLPVSIDPLEADSSRWAVNWPREYSAYRQMQDDTTRTKFGGSFPRDYLEETPANVILFAGYGFSKEYRQARGHLYAIEDVSRTERVGPATPATCWTCKSPDVPRMMAELGRPKVADQRATLAQLLLAGTETFSPFPLKLNARPTFPSANTAPFISVPGLVPIIS